MNNSDIFNQKQIEQVKEIWQMRKEEKNQIQFRFSK